MSIERRGGSFRSSGRSRDSVSSYRDPRRRVKDCCRKLVAFMCTQVGVGGLIVCYTVFGAFTFQYIERRDESIAYENVVKERAECAQKLWLLGRDLNTVDEIRFRRAVDDVLVVFQKNVTAAIKKGYDGRTSADTWSFPAALMFSLSIITMIGYGNMVPRTPWGKGLTVLYAVFGIPLYILYFMNMGEVLAGSFRWVYTWLYECSREQTNEPPRRVIVPSTACLWVIGGVTWMLTVGAIFRYVLTGAIMFAEWEKWNYLDSTYFCVTSLCKIGFGDLVPGANISDSKGGSQTKLVINFVYMLVGLGLVAMCYNLMREEVRVKMQELREDMSQCLEDTRLRLLTCCARCGCKEDNYYY